eukprot:4484187-Amphidinium_carterae.1
MGIKEIPERSCTTIIEYKNPQGEESPDCNSKNAHSTQMHNNKELQDILEGLKLYLFVFAPMVWMDGYETKVLKKTPLKINASLALRSEKICHLRSLASKLSQ